MNESLSPDVITTEQGVILGYHSKSEKSYEPSSTQGKIMVFRSDQIISAIYIRLEVCTKAKSLLRRAHLTCSIWILLLVCGGVSLLLRLDSDARVQ